MLMVLLTDCGPVAILIYGIVRPGLKFGQEGVPRLGSIADVGLKLNGGDGFGDRWGRCRRQDVASISRLTYDVVWVERNVTDSGLDGTKVEF